LRQVIDKLGPAPADPSLIVGYETADDAAVYRLDDRTALVQTVDFITPIVDDPYTFGAVAAANSLSDVYAMGGRPLTALNIVCFPEDKMPIEVLVEILRGSADKCREAGCLVVGGHTVSDPELKFGLSVTGLVAPDRVVRNGGAVAGDALVLTKPLGTGILATAMKKGRLEAASARALERSLLELNDRAAREMLAAGAHAGTDITGFGLLGHGMEMAVASAARLVFQASLLPCLPDALELARRGVLTGADKRNREYTGDRCRIEAGVSEAAARVAFDAQTSGGLLVALAPEGAAAMCRALPGAVVIGRVESGPGEVLLVP
jgi:selenide,water dikinase